MRQAFGLRFSDLRRVIGAIAALVALAIGAPPARTATLEELVSSVVRIKTFINPDGQTVQSLGREREGSGIVIDEEGLVLTIGYLMVEAHAAEIVTNAGRTVPATIVGYDHESGFGILRAIQPLKLKPLSFGRSADVKVNDPVLVASHGGPTWCRRRASPPSASSPAAGNTCSTRRSSPRRRIRPGAALR